MAYFLALVLQFQFHDALCAIAQPNAPLYNCSIYKSKEAGTKFREMLQLGSSRPWQKALETLLGKPQMSAKPILKYFRPLRKWLKRENARNGRKCGFHVRKRAKSSRLSEVSRTLRSNVGESRPKHTKRRRNGGSNWKVTFSDPTDDQDQDM
jgi:5-enolpyruvylshikimate-3-phosphate synthase